MVTKKISSTIFIALFVIGVLVCLNACAATCVTCNTCPNTVGMAGYN